MVSSNVTITREYKTWIAFTGDFLHFKQLNYFFSLIFNYFFQTQFDSLLKHLSELEMKDDHELLLILIKVLLEADSIVGGNHSFVVKENMIIILSRILQTHHGLIDLSKIGKYFIDETDIKRISNSPLNEQGYIAALQTFSLGMRYLILTDIGNVHEFVSLLENMIEKESAEKTSNIALDFIIKIVSEEKPKNENLILNNLIPNNSMKNDTRQAILKSKSIYRYLIRRLKNDTNIRLCETLLVLSEFLRKVVWEPSLIRTLSNFCKRHYNNSNLMIPFVTCMDILLEKLVSFSFLIFVNLIHSPLVRIIFVFSIMYRTVGMKTVLL